MENGERGKRDPLDRIAASYERLLDTQQYVAETTRQINATQRLGMRVHAFAIAMVGLGLLLLGLVAWQSRAVLYNTQIIEAHTKVLLERYDEALGRKRP